MTTWRGKRALITGASSGIGAAVARRLAAEGIDVILTARRRQRLEEVARSIVGAGGRADILPADLGSAEAREALVRDLLAARPGGVDLLVNNAGFGYGADFAAMPWATMAAMLEVNVGAIVHLTRLLLPPMLERRSGWIVNIASIAGEIPGPPLSLYCASKAMVQALSEALYREYRQRGIYIGMVNPGPVATPFWAVAAGWEAKRWHHFGVSAERVAEAVWWAIRHRRKRVYVPWGMRVVRWLNLLAAPVVDRAIPWFLRGPGKQMMHR